MPLKRIYFDLQVLEDSVHVVQLQGKNGMAQGRRIEKKSSPQDSQDTEGEWRSQRQEYTL